MKKNMIPKIKIYNDKMIGGFLSLTNDQVRKIKAGNKNQKTCTNFYFCSDPSTGSKNILFCKK